MQCTPAPHLNGLCSLDTIYSLYNWLEGQPLTITFFIFNLAIQSRLIFTDSYKDLNFSKYIQYERGPTRKKLEG